MRGKRKRTASTETRARVRDGSQQADGKTGKRRAASAAQASATETCTPEEVAKVIADIGALTATLREQASAQQPTEQVAGRATLAPDGEPFIGYVELTLRELGLEIALAEALEQGLSFDLHSHHRRVHAQFAQRLRDFRVAYQQAIALPSQPASTGVTLD